MEQPQPFIPSYEQFSTRDTLYSGQQQYSQQQADPQQPVAQPDASPEQNLFGRRQDKVNKEPHCHYLWCPRDYLSYIIIFIVTFN